MGKPFFKKNNRLWANIFLVLMTLKYVILGYFLTNFISSIVMQKMSNKSILWKTIKVVKWPPIFELKYYLRCALLCISFHQVYCGWKVSHKMSQISGSWLAIFFSKLPFFINKGISKRNVCNFSIITLQHFFQLFFLYYLR